MTIKLLLVDDHTVMREGLRVLLEKRPEFEVVGEAADGRTALKLKKQRRTSSSWTSECAN
jgi:two-component system, NarL family, nitrate/nitrite response regulator NarL